MLKRRVKTGGRQKRVRSDYELQLHKNITEHKRIDGPPYSPKTVDIYVNNIEKLSRNFLGKDETMSDLKWLEQGKNVITFLDTTTTNQGNKYSLETKLSKIASLVIGLQSEGYGVSEDDPILKPYYDKMKSLRPHRSLAGSQKYTSGTTTSNNQIKVLKSVKEQDIFNMVDKMNEEAFKGKELVNRKLFMIATIIAVHSELPFRNDLADVKIIGKKKYEDKVKSGENKGFNWLILDKKKGRYYGFQFVLNEFKTKTRYGMIIGDVETPLVKEQLHRWIKFGHFGDEVEDTYLFSNEEGRALTRNNISVLLTNETKKYTGGSPISTTLLAKIFNDTPQDYKKITHADVLKMENKSYLRGHTPMERIFHYSKNDTQQIALLKCLNEIRVNNISQEKQLNPIPHPKSVSHPQQMEQNTPPMKTTFMLAEVSIQVDVPVRELIDYTFDDINELLQDANLIGQRLNVVERNRVLAEWRRSGGRQPECQIPEIQRLTPEYVQRIWQDIIPDCSDIWLEVN